MEIWARKTEKRWENTLRKSTGKRGRLFAKRRDDAKGRSTRQRGSMAYSEHTVGNFAITRVMVQKISDAEKRPQKPQLVTKAAERRK